MYHIIYIMSGSILFCNIIFFTSASVYYNVFGIRMCCVRPFITFSANKLTSHLHPSHPILNSSSSHFLPPSPFFLAFTLLLTSPLLYFAHLLLFLPPLPSSLSSLSWPSILPPILSSYSPTPLLFSLFSPTSLFTLLHLSSYSPFPPLFSLLSSTSLLTLLLHLSSHSSPPCLFLLPSFASPLTPLLHVSSHWFPLGGRDHSASWRR